ncbi:MAG: ABC transporter permease [Rhizobiaceae bacterium]
MRLALLRWVAVRIAGMILVLAGTSVLIFGIARIIPGDPARIALGPEASAEQVEMLRERLHLDEPFVSQYVEFVRDLLGGDLGMSLYTKRPVTSDIATALPATLELVFAAGLLMALIGIPLGILSAYWRDRVGDHVIRLVALLGVVTPSFVWAIFLMLGFAYFTDLLPAAGRLSQGVPPPPTVTGMYTLDALLTGQWSVFGDALAHMVLPTVALALSGIGQMARLTRASVAETYRTPYIDMAVAYGYAPRRIATKYALRPALIPTLTVFGLDFANMLGAAFLVEQVFAWPGLARYGVQAILHKDLNAIVGVVLVISAFFLIVNTLVDIAVAWINPRIRLQGEAG